MSDTPQNPEEIPPRDPVTGRYLRRHSAEDRAGAPEPPPPPPQATADVPMRSEPPAPAAPPAAKDDKEGRKRWMLLLLALLILLALLCAGFSYLTWWRKDEPVAQPPESPAVSATATASPRTSPSPSAAASPTPSPSPSPSKRTISMPNVVGMPAADAKVILEGAGFVTIRFATDANPGADLSVLASHTVTGQSVTAGTQTDFDAPIVITVRTTSNGKG